MQEYLNRGQVVCCVGWLLFLEEGKGLRSLNCKVVGEVAQVTVKSHWQETALFSMTELLSAAARVGGSGSLFSPARLLQLKWPCEPAPCQRHGFLYLGRGLNTGDPDLELGRGDGGSFVPGSSTFCDFLTKNRGRAGALRALPLDPLLAMVSCYSVVKNAASEGN